MYKDSKNVKIIKIFQPEVGQMAFKIYKPNKRGLAKYIKRLTLKAS